MDLQSKSYRLFGAAGRLTRNRLLLRFWPVVVLASVYLIAGLALRLVLWWSFGRAVPVPAHNLFWILPTGLLADALQSLYLLAPFILYITLMPDRWYRSKFNRRLLQAGAALFVFGLLYLAAVEYFFFEEFNARFNLVSFDYLMYPHEVMIDIWDSYPVLSVLLGAAALTAAAVFALRHQLVSGTTLPISLRERSKPAALIAILLGGLAASVDSSVFASAQNRVAGEISGNGLASFFRAARTNEIDYSAYYASRKPSDNLHLLSHYLGQNGGRFVRLDEGRMDREFAPDPKGLGRLNVVVVVEESFGAEFSRLHGSARDWMPNFDAYAARGVWFRNAYASGTRTVRGLEAITASFPPIPSVSILRRPGNEHIATWGSVMREKGYHTSFLYGGYGYFDNMNYFYGSNGFETIDRSNIPQPRFANIWGVSDEDLFDKALEYYDQRQRSGQPFFSMIMTTSNHKPFTFRPGVPGVPAEGGGRAAGVRYADYALGSFLRHAERHRWFDNTLFVVIADHGARVYGRAQIPLRSYEIPLLLYSPRHLSPRTVATLTTQIDVAPTVLGMLGVGYRAPFFGQNVLSAQPEQQRVAFFSHNHDVAIYQNGELSVLGLQKEIDGFRYDRAHDRYQSIAPDPVLTDLGIAYYQTAFELFRSHRYE